MSECIIQCSCTAVMHEFFFYGHTSSFISPHGISISFCRSSDNEIALLLCFAMAFMFKFTLDDLLFFLLLLVIYSMFRGAGFTVQDNAVDSGVMSSICCVLPMSDIGYEDCVHVNSHCAEWSCDHRCPLAEKNNGHNELALYSSGEQHSRANMAITV